MRIGELSRRAGVSVRALRYYEEQGLLEPSRTPNGYREFAESDVLRVAKIQLLFSAGLGSSKIVDVLPSVCGSGLETYREPEPGLVEELLPTRDLIASQIADLTKSLTKLDRLITAARGEVARQ